MVPLIDLKRKVAASLSEYVEATKRVFESGRFLLGAETSAFEGEFAEFVGGQHAVAVGSGSDALRLSLVAAGVGPGDEVIVPAFTAVPTAAAVCALGAVPVFVDVDADTAALDSVAAEKAITQLTKAIVCVHLYGRPAQVPESHLRVIEDAAQAHGALNHGQRHGSFATAYSFYPTKNLGGVTDGGAIVTSDEAVAERLRRLRHHGMRSQYVHDEISLNSRMSEVDAAILRIELNKLSAGNARRRQIAQRYREAAPKLRWQADHPDHVYHLCVARVENRDRWRKSLPFTTGVHYPLALTEQPAYRQFVREPCPNAEAWAAECVSLPCFPELTDSEVDEVCLALQRAQD